MKCYFRRNIVFTPYRPIRVPVPWGKEIDHNLLHAAGRAAAAWKNTGSGRDEHSIIADAEFIDPATGDYRVKDSSPAIALGLGNFPMDSVGVVSPQLRKLARTPRLPAASAATQQATTDDTGTWLGAGARAVVGLEILSALGQSEEVGVALTDVPADSPAAQIGLHPMDVVLRIDGQAVNTVESLSAATAAAGTQALRIELRRGGQILTLTAAPGGE